VLVCPAGQRYGANICDGYSGHERLFGNTYNVMPGFGSPRAYPYDERTHEVVMLVDGSQNFIDVWGLGNANSLYNFPASMGTQADYDSATADDPVSDVGTDIDDQMSQMRFRHGGRVNVVFLDGHASSMGKTDFRRRNFSISP
jgi:prepilin-type processing-associated H-X9-DG protein